MMNYERRTPHPEPIPEFHSREEEAAFWDSHDLVDYWETFKPVRVRFNKQLSEGITVRLDPETLRQRAHALGIGPTSLARIWILGHLRDKRREKSEF
jgi:hypothetical protein